MRPHHKISRFFHTSKHLEIYLRQQLFSEISEDWNAVQTELADRDFEWF